MKKLYLSVFNYALLSMFGLASILQSCKKGGFLTSTTTSNLTEATVFKDSARTMGFLSNIYASVGYSASPSRFVYNPLTTKQVCGGLEAACDEAESSHAFSTSASAFATGTINAGIVDDGPYTTCYTNIRAVNQLLKNLPSTPLQAFNKQKVVAEAHFLRAWFYAMLLKHYGGVPLVGNTILSYETPIDVKRSTYEQCVNYILAECDSASKVLPLVQTGQDYGRASKGAAMALKARVLLYAASPLFNGTTLVADAGSAPAGFDPALVGYPTFSAERWKAAADAARDVIGSGGYALNSAIPSGISSSVKSNPGWAFQYLFPQRENTEYIFESMRGDNTEYEDLFLPPSRNGANGSYPYQGLVDAFPMKNGKLITDPTSGYDPTNPYAGRDPRMDYSITHDQSIMLIRTGNGLTNGSGPVNIYMGTYNGVPANQDAVHQGTVTGYYNNKMLDPNATSSTIAFKTKRVLPLIRFAEILLDFAEATNEYAGPTADVYNAVNTIRQRAGLDPYALPAGLTKETMRTYIQNERRVELAYEEHRFWDVRRWKIAPVTENVQAKGMEVVRNGNAVTFNQFNVTKHNFRAAMYLWPFPLSETGKSASLLQNPGY